jgi:hypothetical protein
MGLARCGAGLGKVLRAVAQDHGLARACHAVNHAVPVAQAAGQLLLLQVQHAHDVGQLGVCVVVVKQSALGLHAHLREHDPAHAVQLRQGDGAAKAVGKHVPQALLKRLRVGRLFHLVFADHVVSMEWFRPAPRRQIACALCG